MKNLWRNAFYISVLVWLAAVIGVLLVTAEKPQEAEEVTDEVAEEVTETAIYITEEANDVIEEPDDQVDLAKMKQIVNATVTAYCICEKCCGKDESHPAYGITAGGRPAEPFVSVAVDPFMIELGSTVYIDYGDGELLEFRADDTGSGVAGAHIDVCYPDHQSALEHGVREARVYWGELR